MSFFEEIVQLTTKSIAAQREKELAGKMGNIRTATPAAERLYPLVDKTIREKAGKGESSLDIEFSDYDDDYNTITSPVIGEFGSLKIPGMGDSQTMEAAGAVLAQHYSEQGFSASSSYESVYISWLSEQDKQEIGARSALLQARIDNVKSARILGTVISEEGSNGHMTNYVMHTVRLIYQDGKIDLITIRESDPFMRGIIEKLEN